MEVIGLSIVSDAHPPAAVRHKRRSFFTQLSPDQQAQLFGDDPAKRQYRFPTEHTDQDSQWQVPVIPHITSAFCNKYLSNFPDTSCIFSLLTLTKFGNLQIESPVNVHLYFEECFPMGYNNRCVFRSTTRKYIIYAQPFQGLLKQFRLQITFQRMFNFQSHHHHQRIASFLYRIL